ncbi:hypothetical protein ACHAXT_005558 [Thalassiosira profunda]
MSCHRLLSLLLMAMGPAVASTFASIRPPSAISSLQHLPVLAAKTRSDDALTLPPHFTSPSTLDWLQKMAASYKLERGEELLDVILRESTAVSSSDDTSHAPNNLAILMATTNLPIAAHDFLRDPSGDAIYCYGNLAFLDGFGYSWDEFIELPSRKCVTEEEVAERQRLLDAVKANAMNTESSERGGYSASDYDNLVRIRKDGGRILLRGINLWNVYDISPEDSSEATRAAIESGEINAIGQAVWIRHVDYLENSP